MAEREGAGVEKVELNTIMLADRTIGFGEYGGFNFCTLELPWRFNQKNVSCIPAGTYEAIKIDHYRFGKSIEILNVPDRTEIMVHPGNFTHEIEGCLLPGSGLKDIDSDGRLDVTNSTATLKRLCAMLPDRFHLVIRRCG